MRALDRQFTTRVLQTSFALGAVAALPMLASGLASGMSFVAGLACVALVWRGAQAVVGGLDRQCWRARHAGGLAAVWVTKYVVCAAALWVLARTGQLAPHAFAAGATIPLAVGFLKAIGRIHLPPECDPVPYYARDRKAASVE